MEPRPVAGNKRVTGLIPGAVAAHACGTDNAPIEAARPNPARYRSTTAAQTQTRPRTDPTRQGRLRRRN